MAACIICINCMEMYEVVAGKKNCHLVNRREWRFLRGKVAHKLSATVAVLFRFLRKRFCVTAG